MAGKRYKQLSEKIDMAKSYSVADAAAFVKELKSAKLTKPLKLHLILVLTHVTLTK